MSSNKKGYYFKLNQKGIKKKQIEEEGERKGRSTSLFTTKLKSAQPKNRETLLRSSILYQH